MKSFAEQRTIDRDYDSNNEPLRDFCMKYTAPGESRVANTVWRKTLAGGNVGESSVFFQTKTIQISICN